METTFKGSVLGMHFRFMGDQYMDASTKKIGIINFFGKFIVQSLASKRDEKAWISVCNYHSSSHFEIPLNHDECMITLLTCSPPAQLASLEQT